MDDDVIDLTFVRQAKEESERFLCPLCPSTEPESVLIKQTDPSKLEFVGPGITRWLCTRCGYQVDEVPENSAMLRRQERISTILGDPASVNSGQPFIQAIKSERKDKLRGTAHSNVADVGLAIEPNESQNLRSEGIQIKREETKSSVTGHIKNYDRPKREREK
jgi:hypothetical protein